jgi:microcystin-dependent protein
MKLGVKRILFLVFVALLAVVQTAYAGVPPMINYQGALTDKDGVSVANGNYDMEFKIYDVPSGGAALWSEKWDVATSQVPVVGGIFNTMLGFQSPIPTGLFAKYPETYLGIKVGTDSEMLPRQQITSVGYAFTAGNGVPKGGIIMWSGAVEQIPDGWALCDGIERTLSDASVVTPPNLRDRFVVGAGNVYAVAATGGEAAHSLTIAEMPLHTHTQNAHNHGISDPGHYHALPLKQDNQDGSGSNGTTAGSSNSSAATTGISINNSTATNQNTGGSAAHNNLPPYYALAYIMKL